MPKRRSTVKQFLNGPVVGALTGSVAAALPKELVERLLGKILPGTITEGLKDLEARVHLPSGRIIFFMGGFVIGLVGRKYVVSKVRKLALTRLFRYQDWVYGQNTRTKIWGLLVALFEGPGEYETFEFQDCLPKQPLPDLDATLERWLEVSKAFVTDSEYKDTEEAVKEFRATEGRTLQEHLQSRAKREANWLKDYWSNAAYLYSRDSLMYNSNYFNGNAVPEHVTRDQLARAACTLHAIAKFYQTLEAKEMDPVMLQDAVPLCMDGYRYLFNSTRIPGEHMDTMQKYPGNEYIVVIRNGQYFKLDLFEREGFRNKSLLTQEELKEQLKKICKEADGAKSDLPVAALTAQKRNIWAKNRELLRANNKDTLDAIEKCMFVFILDTASPKDAKELNTLLTTGRGYDRWFDKCVNTVVFANCAYGNNVEHTSLDAMVFASFSADILGMERYEKGDIVRDASQPARPLEAPKRLKWKLKGLESIIESAMTEFQNAANDVDCHVEIAPYGKGFMKKCRLSPDGFIQMGLQLAYYRMHKEFPKTYEPSTHRLYKYGRTETVHPGSEASKSWVLSMDDSKVAASKRKALLKEAIEHQNKFRLDATVGKGCDRHLLGLLCASMELGMSRPKLFLDKAWTKPFQLSTSQTPNRIYETCREESLIFSLSNGGFGSTDPEGYGVSYLIYGDNMLNINIACVKSCNKTDSAKFGEAIREAFLDMKKLFDTANGTSANGTSANGTSANGTNGVSKKHH